MWDSKNFITWSWQAVDSDFKNIAQKAGADYILVDITQEIPSLVFLTQWYWTKIRDTLSNVDYFKLIFLKFKTFIYNSINKIM